MALSLDVMLQWTNDEISGIKLSRKFTRYIPSHRGWCLQGEIFQHRRSSSKFTHFFIHLSSNSKTSECIIEAAKEAVPGVAAVVAVEGKLSSSGCSLTV